jgi:hypothetical protein
MATYGDEDFARRPDEHAPASASSVLDSRLRALTSRHASPNVARVVRGQRDIPHSVLVVRDVGQVLVERRMPGEAGAQLEGQREDELTKRDARQDVVDQVGRGLGHAAAEARGAEAAALARERDERTLAAVRVFAAQEGEAASEHAAVDEGFELVAHERGEWRREAVLDGGVERAEVFAHDGVQGRGLGLSPSS